MESILLTQEVCDQYNGGTVAWIDRIQRKFFMGSIAAGKNKTGAVVLLPKQVLVVHVFWKAQFHSAEGDRVLRWYLSSDRNSFSIDLSPCCVYGMWEKNVERLCIRNRQLRLWIVLYKPIKNSLVLKTITDSKPGTCGETEVPVFAHFD